MIAMGHARALVNIIDEELQLDIYKCIISEGLSVRQTEDLAKSAKQNTLKQKNTTTTTTTTTNTPLPFSVQQLSQEFERKMNYNSEIKLQKSGMGKLIISFKNEEELEHIIKCFQKE